eukprot:239647-Rhodomonas_salina.1
MLERRAHKTKPTAQDKRNLNPKAQSPNPKPETLNPGPSINYPKPSSTYPEPQPLNPKTSTSKCRHSAATSRRVSSIQSEHQPATTSSCDVSQSVPRGTVLL